MVEVVEDGQYDSVALVEQAFALVVLDCCTSLVSFASLLLGIVMKGQHSHHHHHHHDVP